MVDHILAAPIPVVPPFGPNGAVERAERLLREHLTPRQLAQYERHHAFECVGQVTKLPYVIRPGYSQNILINYRAPVCVVAGPFFTKYPIADHMLMQKLWIEQAEEAFLKIAGLSVVLKPRPASWWGPQLFRPLDAPPDHSTHYYFIPPW